MKYAKKSLGQNFLKDKNIIKKILNLSKIHNKNIIEIGPGNGELTKEILKKKPKSLIIIEKDNLLCSGLKLKYSHLQNLQIYNSDILKFNLEVELKNDTVIFGNLPYNISSQILVKILRLKNWPSNITDIIFMFQKELGEKIIGKFSTTNYGRISILANYRLRVLNKFYVSRNCFFPKPKVTSIVIHFKPRKDLFKIRYISNLEKVTNILFSNKRKMINKNLRKLLKKNTIIKHPEINLRLRPSDVDELTFYKITELFEKDHS